MRAKTLFASTRTTLIRELGRERFEGRNLFLTDPGEVLDPREWRGREGEGEDEGPFTREERELRSVRRAEDEERYGGGTKGRDIMGNGGGEKMLGFKAIMDDPAKQALAEMGRAVPTEGGGTFVQLVRRATASLLISCD